MTYCANINIRSANATVFTAAPAANFTVEAPSVTVIEVAAATATLTLPEDCA